MIVELSYLTIGTANTNRIYYCAGNSLKYDTSFINKGSIGIQAESNQRVTTGAQLICWKINIYRKRLATFTFQIENKPASFHMLKLVKRNRLL